MEYYSSYNGELKNKWQSQKISKKYKNRHVKKSKPTRVIHKLNKKCFAKKRRLGHNVSASNLYKSNQIKTPEQQLISSNYYHIKTTINISIYFYNIKTKKKKKDKKIKKIKPKMPQKVSLTEHEQAAVDFVKAKSMGKSTNAEKKLKSKLSNLKLESLGKKKPKQYVYEQVMNFIQHKVPMIIHVHPGTISKLLKDTHYRNLFEIGTGSGCTNKETRKKFETEMFGSCYSNSNVTPTEKPKYGCLNIGLSQNGIQSAQHYGKCFFTLNDSTVRWRTSLTTEDSFCSKGDFGTMNNCAHLLNKLSDGELEKICDTAISSKIQSYTGQYREIQIHGPVLLNRDIVSLHVPSSERKNEYEYYQFAQQNGCELIWF